MFNRSEILRSAWASYRIARTAIWAAGDESGKRAFIRQLFAKMLRSAWDSAKKTARAVTDTATAFVAAQRRVQVAAVAAMEPMARSSRIVEIRSELQVLDYAPLGVRTLQRRAHLGAELQMLNA